MSLHQFKGTLTLGDAYGENAGKTTDFEISFELHDDTFSGTSSDVGGFGVNPHPAEISGVIEGGKIRFVKVYPNMHFNSRGKTVLSKNKSPKIYYQGSYDDARSAYSGTWEMQVKRVFFGLIPINHKSVGTWQMNEVKP